MTKSLSFKTKWSASLVATALMVASATASAQAPPASADAPPPEKITGEQTLPTPPVVAPAAVVTYPSMAKTGTMMMLGPDSWLRFGFQAQVWANYQQALTAAGNYSFDEYLRRARLFVAGQFFKDVGIFVLFDSPNLGKALQTGAGTEASPFVVSKQFTPAIVQDMFGEVKFAGDAFMLEAGLMVVPFSHNGLQSTTSYLGLDVSNTAAILAGTQTSALRDTGFQLKGYEADDKFEWRLFVGSGLREVQNGDNPVAHNGPRITGHVQYQIFDPDNKGYVYTGMAYGKKKLLTLAAGFDFQTGDNLDAYSAFSAGVSGNFPLAGDPSPQGGDEIAFVAEYYHYDGGTVFATKPAMGAGAGLVPQNDFLGEVAYYHHDSGFGIFARFEMEKTQDTQNQGQDKMWFGGGLKYFVHDSFCNFTLAYQRVQFPNAAAGAPDGTNDIVLQLQVYYF